MAVQHVKHFLKEMGQPVDRSNLESILYDSNKINELDKKAQKLLSNSACKSLVSSAIPLPETTRIELHTVAHTSDPIVDGMKDSEGGGDGGIQAGAVVATAYKEDASVRPMQED